MKTTFTIPECFALRGCYTREQIAEITHNKPHITIQFIIDHPHIKLTEKAWWIINNCQLTPEEQAKFATSCAEIALNELPDQIQQKLKTDPQRTAQALGKPQCYAAFALLTDDPQDKAFAATRSATDPTKFLDYFKEFFS